ncbi:MAG: cytochrome P450, partial [Pseudomonadota bacterium]
ALAAADLSLRFVKEILRLYPAGWWTTREVAMPTTMGERQFKRGDTIMVSPYQLHRDPRLWGSADQFDLERDFKDRAYMPFGLGHRACVGMSMAMIELQLFTLLIATSLQVTLPEHCPCEPIPSVTLLYPDTNFPVTARTPSRFRSAAA